MLNKLKVLGLFNTACFTNEIILNIACRYPQHPIAVKISSIILGFINYFLNFIWCGDSFNLYEEKNINI